LPFGGSPLIHAGEERFRAFCVPTHFVGERSEKAPAGITRFSAGLFSSHNNRFRREIFCASQKYSSRTGFRALYFSPVEFFRRRVVPCSMFCETESKLQIAAQTRAARSGAFRRAPQPRPRISLVAHHSLAQRRLAASKGSLITPASRILIVTPRLAFPANTTKQTLPAISNRYKIAFFYGVDSPWRIPFLHLSAVCTSHFAALPSSLPPLIPRLQNLIANLGLELCITPIRITNLQFSNRKFFAISSSLNRAAHRKVAGHEGPNRECAIKLRANRQRFQPFANF
jgi:hypothetical protein